MRREWTMLRLLLIRSGYKRGDYLKKIHYFHRQGEHCFFTSLHFGTEPWLLSFGNNVHVATGVSFVSHDVVGQMLDAMEPDQVHANRVGPIEIGDNVFIGAKATILYDVKIGSNVIIAAGSLVNRDIPDGTVYGGVPARQIGTFDAYAAKNRVYSKTVPWNNRDSLEVRKERQIEYYWNRREQGD